MLAGVLERCMKRRGVRDSDPYDWEKLPDTPQSLTTSSTSTGAASKPQQKAGAENAADDPLGTSNNQENMQPDAPAAPVPAVPATGASSSPPQAAPSPEKRTPLQTAQVVVAEEPAEAKAPENGTDKSPKKRKMDEAPAAPALSARVKPTPAEAATPDSVIETDNSRRQNEAADGEASGFAPLAVSASMPAVLVGARSARGFGPSHSVPQSPCTPAEAGPAASGAGSPALGPEKGGARGRTNLRRFHSMHAHNHSPGSSARGGPRPSRGNRASDALERGADTSYTQCALAEDDNVSALQQMTRAGGG